MKVSRLPPLLWLVVIAACGGTPVAPVASAPDPVELSELHANQTFVISGGLAEVHGVVANTGATPIHGLRLGVAVAQDSGGGSVRWRERGELSRVIPELRPGERVAVSTRVEVTGDGWLRLGFAGQYNEGMLFPRGERIRVVDPAMSALELVALVAALTGILAIATAALSAFSRACRKPRTMARAWLRLAGVCLGVAIIGWQQLPFVLYGRSSLVEPIADAGLVIFAFGWYLATVHYVGWLRTGLGIAGSSYAVVGLLWAIMLPLLIGTLPTQILRDPATASTALSWPFQVVQIVFGIRF